MYYLCQCGAVFHRSGHGGPTSSDNIKHFSEPGHKFVGRYTFPDNIPGPYFLVNPNRKNKGQFWSSKNKIEV